MTTFDPERFEEKYVHYLEELETAYKAAFETMNERFDSDLVHAIDQRVLNESEPVYDEGGGFHIELPEDPAGRLQGVLASEEKIEATLERYVEELERELRRVFEFEN